MKLKSEVDTLMCRFQRQKMKTKKTYGVVPQEERKNRPEKSSDCRGIADCGKRPGERD
jgi:hypothetical protein